jgi:hypothetical protein
LQEDDRIELSKTKALWGVVSYSEHPGLTETATIASGDYGLHTGLEALPAIHEIDTPYGFLPSMRI